MMMGNELEKYDRLNLLQLMSEKNSMQPILLRRKSHDTEQDRQILTECDTQGAPEPLS